MNFIGCGLLPKGAVFRFKKQAIMTRYQVRLLVIYKQARGDQMSDSMLLPDTLRNWPWGRHLNPNYTVCKKESTAWFESFRAFDRKAQHASNKCDPNLLASLAYPLLDKAGCRLGCDLMNLLYVIDEHSDTANDKGARIIADIVMDAIRNPYTPRPKGEWIGGEVARQFWYNAIQIATPNSQNRFVNAFQAYMDGVVTQAEDRVANHIRSVDTYFAVRRNTIGAKPSFAICEIYMNIPDDIIQHPVIAKLSELCIDMIIIGNDLCSYNVEQARGDDGHNLVTVVMHQYDLDVQSSMDWISNYHDELVRQFMEGWQKIPTFGGPMDREVRIYCDGLGNWVRANDSFSFESERYFGKEGLSIQATRKVTKLPIMTPPKDSSELNGQIGDLRVLTS